MIPIKTQADIDVMREVNSSVAKVLRHVTGYVKPGVTTAALDEAAADFIKSEMAGFRPAFLGYMGYPSILCTSVNEEVVHGLPGSRTLESGDIIGIDCGLEKDGFYGDSAVTIPVGEISGENKRLLSATLKSLYLGIQQARVGNTVFDIAKSIETYLNQCGYGIVREFVGHGIGKSLHEEPQVPNYTDAAPKDILKAGMTICIEPMVTLGQSKVKVLGDGWTAVTRDGSMAAHYEHAIVITEEGPQILSYWNDENPEPYDGLIHDLLGFKLEENLYV